MAHATAVSIDLRDVRLTDILKLNCKTRKPSF